MPPGQAWSHYSSLDFCPFDPFDLDLIAFFTLHDESHVIMGCHVMLPNSQWFMQLLVTLPTGHAFPTCSLINSGGSRISQMSEGANPSEEEGDGSEVGCQTTIWPNVSENCMKAQKILRGGSSHQM